MATVTGAEGNDETQTPYRVSHASTNPRETMSLKRFGTALVASLALGAGKHASTQLTKASSWASRWMNQKSTQW